MRTAGRADRLNCRELSHFSVHSSHQGDRQLPFLSSALGGSGAQRIADGKSQAGHRNFGRIRTRSHSYHAPLPVSVNSELEFG
jgi:hypothetical protein